MRHSAQRSLVIVQWPSEHSRLRHRHVVLGRNTMLFPLVVLQIHHGLALEQIWVRAFQAGGRGDAVKSHRQLILRGQLQ